MPGLGWGVFWGFIVPLTQPSPQGEGFLLPSPWGEGLGVRGNLVRGNLPKGNLANANQAIHCRYTITAYRRLMIVCVTALAVSSVLALAW